MFDNDLQFYPTPPGLAARAWSKFKNREFVRILEPSAGKGDLALGRPRMDDPYNRNCRETTDCIEINIEMHAGLREKGFSVIGTDFLDYSGPGAIYSHIIMNPPFNAGADHVLKAWELMYDGEIVAILNAETIRNPFSRARQHLASLIERYGDVEFIADAFVDAERTTSVEVALVYLRKESTFSVDIVGSLLNDLQKDRTTAEDLAAGIDEINALAVPGSLIENSVLAFNAAVAAAREAEFSCARSAYYAGLLGQTLEGRNMEQSTTKNLFQGVQNRLHKSYVDLKDRAWAGIIRSAQVMSMLSSQAQKRVEADFEKIKQLDFTVKNIYGFLQGLSASQGEIQREMVCDVFDMISRYHSDNAVFYMGWKSNDKHRTAGMKIKTTRFIIPGHAAEKWRTSLSWDSEQMLRDFDKVFAMLDGKTESAVGLLDIFRNQYKDLRDGKRVSSSYFDVRYYPGVGTIHFFPRDKGLITRLNLVVGRHRRWLPPEEERVSKEFWLQYDRAEKLDKEVREAVHKNRSNRWDDPFWGITSKAHDRYETASESVCEGVASVLTKHGIDPERMLEAPDEPATQAALPLLKAAG